PDAGRVHRAQGCGVPEGREQHRGSEGARRARDGGRHRGRHRRRPARRPQSRGAGDARLADPRADGPAAPAARVLHRGAPGLQRGSAAQSGEECGGGVRVVLQRVARAEVRVAGRVTGKIGAGFLVLAGFAPSDGDANLTWMADKVLGLRVFGDAAGKMNLALAEVGGALLVVSQFALYGAVSKVRRPNFNEAAPTEDANELDARIVALLGRRGTGC